MTSPRAKACYSAGRFVAVEDGVALFALPNAAHRDFCAEAKPEVEAALRAHFHVAVPLRLVVDDARRGPPARPRPRAPRPRPAPGRPGPPTRYHTIPTRRSFDPDDVAEPVAMESVAEARLLEAFPGAQEVAE